MVCTFALIFVAAAASGAAKATPTGPESPDTDPAIAAILQAVDATQPAYLLLNENHDVDWHRHVSACVLAALAPTREMLFAAEAFPRHPPLAEADPASSGGYTRSHYFQDIWRVLDHHQIAAFGYDARRADHLTDDGLAQRGLSARLPNRRDRVAAERLEDLRRQRQPELIMVHAGHAHVSERWGETQDGAHGWLTAHLAKLSGRDPVTVYQMPPQTARWYHERSIFILDHAACAALPEAAVLLRTGEGMIGCAERARLQPTQDVDFIILDDVNRGETARDRPALCDIPQRR
ncbi:hypothetical protein L2D00_05955 [Hyphomonadaceae bacterium BL14]|nr:hypothetical protein L2D00_05955 [Hyphomonadaceae bacterium BL14]